MDAMVLYESLWGNTAAVARAIAVGIGPSTRVAHTGEASPQDVVGLDLLVVGSPVHAMTLPTKQSLTGVARRQLGPGDIPADLDQPLLRDWLAAMPATTLLAAAFDTRVSGFVGRGGTTTIERLLVEKGCQLATRGEGFLVGNYGALHASGSMLKEGELTRAEHWGEGLRELAFPGGAVR
ncbi:hypothetical protein LGT39_04070 [Demequina sp. TTPB684]|uniref:flavodoxin family protein n=1 Tax=unclassified Demequina TaxID=2620311 RepID=UPI001CF11E93|nr:MULTISPECIES: hypothetical protein [unclassified Demequina]MCB2412025.1 hypothetical protein [Demequina sp. TTPB684]UPU88808.1 hypothetical protein LGT36_002500 [Demequina sp. TMPB413]